MPATEDILGGTVEILVEVKGQFVPLFSVIGLGPTANFVEQVSVKINLLRVVQIDITLDPPLREALEMLQSNRIGLGFHANTKAGVKKAVPVEPPKEKSLTDRAVSYVTEPVTKIVDFLSGISANKIAVKLRYGGRESKWFKGYLIQPDLHLAPTGISITLKAVGLMFPAALKRGAIKNLASDAVVTKREAVDAIFKQFPGMLVLYDPATNGPLKEKLTHKITRGTHLEYAKDILQSANCKFVSLGSDQVTQLETIKVIHTGPRKPAKDGEVKAGISFVAFRQIDPSNGEFPMLEFGAPIQNMMLAGVWSGDTIGVSDPSKDYTQENTARVAPADSVATGNRVYPSNTGIVDTLKNYFLDFVSKVFEYDVTAVGVVDLVPGQLVGIRVADVKELSSDYDLIDVEHIVNASGVETKMKLYRVGGTISKISDYVSTAIGGNEKTSTPAK